MGHRIVVLAGAGLSLAMLAAPAFATPTIAAPEPSTLAIFGSGGAGAALVYAVNRWIRRK